MRPAEALLKLARRVEPWLRLRYSVTDLFRHDLAPVPSVQQPASLELAWLDPAAAPCLQQIGPSTLREADVRLRRGDRCLIGRLAGRPVHYSWIQTAGCHILLDAGLRRVITPGHCWIYDCYTSRPARGRGIYPFVLTHLLREQIAGGSSCAWIYSLRANAASARAIRRAGFRQAEELPAIAIGPWNIPVQWRRAP